MTKLSHLKKINAISGIPLLHQGQVFYTANSNHIYCYDIAKDHVLWDVKSDEESRVGLDRPESIPLNNDELFYCTAQLVKRIHKQTGAILFTTPLVIGSNPYFSAGSVRGMLFDEDYNFSPAIASLVDDNIKNIDIDSDKFHFLGIDDQTFMLWDDTNISIYSYENKNILYQIDTISLIDDEDSLEDDDETISGEPLKYNNIVIFSLYGDIVFAMDALTGQVVWKIQTATANNAGMMSIEGDTLHILNYFAYYEVDINTGTVKREIDTSKILDVMKFKMLSKHVVTKNAIIALFGRGKNSLVLMDREDLSVKQIIDLKGAVDNSNFQYENNIIIIRNMKGVLDIYSINE